MSVPSLKEWQGEIHAWCIRKGWRNENGDPGRAFGEDIALIHSEVSEALEAYRDHGFERYVTITKERKRFLFFKKTETYRLPIKWINYPKGKKPEGVASELADIIIRVLDTAEQYGFDMDYEVAAKMAYNDQREFRHGGKKL